MNPLVSSCGPDLLRRLACCRLVRAKRRLERLVDFHGLLKLVKLDQLRQHGGWVQGVRWVLSFELRGQKCDEGIAS